ncbi:helix-turn-helix transcriptional regulator [Mycobacterium sp. MBM]|nr:helix-turn-helix transcriptional regulator [Mycobacterium sp. MBM]
MTEPTPEHRCCSCVTRQGLTSGSGRRKPALSDREREVLLVWLAGGTKEAVARRLYVSPHTVRTHIERIRDKYDATGRQANSKIALLLRALEDGLIDVDDLAGDDDDV